MASPTPSVSSKKDGGGRQKFDQVFELSSDSFPLLSRTHGSGGEDGSDGVLERPATAPESTTIGGAGGLEVQEDVPRSARLIFESRGKFIAPPALEDDSAANGEHDEEDFQFAMDGDGDSGFAAEYV